MRVNPNTHPKEAGASADPDIRPLSPEERKALKRYRADEPVPTHLKPWIDERGNLHIHCEHDRYCGDLSRWPAVASIFEILAEVTNRRVPHVKWIEYLGVARWQQWLRERAAERGISAGDFLQEIGAPRALFELTSTQRMLGIIENRRGTPPSPTDASEEAI